MQASMMTGVALLLAMQPATAQAQTRPSNLPPSDVRSELERARAEIAQQREQLDRQEQRLRALEARMATGAPPATVGVPPPAGPPAPAIGAAQASGSTVPGDPAGVTRPPSAPLEQVGEAPADADRPPAVAVLGEQGSVVTRRGQLTGEWQMEYARADRNRAIFRGIEVVESVLVGVFDINESRQDVVTAAGTFRYGITDVFEVGVRLPYVYRNDASILAPIQGSTPNDPAATINSSSDGSGIGDLEISARYQLTKGRAGWPFLIANIQAVLPTGTSPFDVRRDALGRQLRAATGAGFYGISPSVTAILPSDPVVLFGTVGYTFNLPDDVNTQIPPVMIERVDPGDAVSFSAGIGVAFNQRTNLNLGYAHSWAFGTSTTTRLLEAGNATWSDPRTSTSRDLQIGRFLFGVTYRTSDYTSLNWSVEVGATDDATDLRTVLRIPFTLITGGRR